MRLGGPGSWQTSLCLCPLSGGRVSAVGSAMTGALCLWPVTDDSPPLGRPSSVPTLVNTSPTEQVSDTCGADPANSDHAVEGNDAATATVSIRRVPPC